MEITGEIHQVSQADHVSVDNPDFWPDIQHVCLTWEQGQEPETEWLAYDCLTGWRA